MSVVAVIPARGGSKRLPGKNICTFAGRPLICWTIDIARATNAIDAVYVNTDDPRIARVATDCGVEVPALRPAALASDEAPTHAGTRWLLDVLADRGEHYDTLVTLQPTSPLRSSADVRAALDLFDEHAPCRVVSVTGKSPQSWYGRFTRDGRFEPLVGEEPLLKLNGAIYVDATADLLAEQKPRRTMAYVMPMERSVDIDTRADFIHAEAMHQRLMEPAHSDS